MNKRVKTNRQNGWTVLEFMLAQSLGLVFIGLAWHYFSLALADYQQSFQTNTLQEEAEYALFVIGQQLRQAGFVTHPVHDITLTGQAVYLPGTQSGMLDARDSASLDNTTLGNFISRTGNSSVEGSDALFIRYYGSGENPADRSVEDCVGYGVERSGDNVGDMDTERGFSGFYVSYTSANAAPTLICLRRAASGSGDAQSIISGVESLQFLFLAIHPTNLSYQWFNATQLKQANISFESVNAIQIGLLIRGTTPCQGNANPNTYTLFGSEANPNTDRGVQVLIPSNRQAYPRALARLTVWRRNVLSAAS
jgi:Tfp pilus assembly protein PilW